MNDRAGERETRPRPRKWARWGLILVAAFITISPVLGWIYVRNLMNSKLRRAIAVADRLDPGWRLAELEGRREVLPDKENSAIQARAVFAEIPDAWLQNKPATDPANVPNPGGGVERGAKLYDSLVNLAPEIQLGAGHVTGLHAELEEVAAAVVKARVLAGMPKGRYPITYGRVFLNTRLNHAEQARTIARLLQMDVILRTQEGDIDGGLDSCRALLNLGRSLGDEPITISQLVRTAITSVALGSLQRVLAQGEASDAALSQVQELLSDEAGQPVALFAIRGERAGAFDMFDKLASGAITLGEIGEPPDGKLSGSNDVWTQIPMPYRYNQALSLEFLNRAVEIAKRPAHEQPDLWLHWKADTRPPDAYLPKVAGILTYLLIPTLDSIGNAQLRSRAVLNSGILMVALERYRLAQGHWPDSPELLVPSFLQVLPTDPYTALPIKVTHRDGGLAVYSVGPDRMDNGGEFHKHSQIRPGSDQGYRLWDVSRRRQTPPAP